MTKADGGPAFPVNDQRTARRSSEGLSLRDYFAAKAVTGIIANLYPASKTVIRDGYRTAKEEAEMAYKIADAMLKARDL